jgi:hypothetical protein
LLPGGLRFTDTPLAATNSGKTHSSQHDRHSARARHTHDDDGSGDPALAVDQEYRYFEDPENLAEFRRVRQENNMDVLYCWS